MVMTWWTWWSCGSGWWSGYGGDEGLTDGQDMVVLRVC